MYQQYLADPDSVDQAWHEFFADYRPGSPVSGGDRTDASSNGSAAAEPAAPSSAPKQEAAPQAPAAKPTPAPAPQKPAESKPAAPSAKTPAAPVASGAQSPLRGAAAAVVKNMNVSLTVPTATS